MNERDWEMMTVLEECGSLTQAAKRLYISQPALSQALQRLEKEIGQPLFYRHNDGLTATFAGKKVTEACWKMLKLKRKLENNANTQDYLLKGKLIIGITNYLGAMLLPDLLQAYKKRFPNMEIIIREAASDELEIMIKSMQVDIGILHAPLKAIDFSAIPLSTHPFVLAMNQTISKQYNIKDNIVDPRLFYDKEWILLYPQQRIRQVSDEIFRQCQIAPKIKMLTRSFETARNLAAAGIGITFLPKDYLSYFGSCNNLCCCDLPNSLKANWLLIAGYAKGWNLSYPAKIFIEMLKTTVFNLEQTYEN